MKQKIKSLVSNCFNTLKKVLNFLFNTALFSLETAVAVTIVAAFALLAVKAPELHSAWIRSKVGSKSYVVYERGRGMGSGFAVVAPSGTTYIVTNDHVCSVSMDNYTVLVEDNDGNSMRRRIIARSEYSDLCLIEGEPGVEGLELGSPSNIGQILAAVGHPAGYDVTLSRGEVIMNRDVVIPLGPIAEVDPRTNQEYQIPPEEGGITEEQCSLPKNRIAVETFVFADILLIKLRMCFVVTENASYTNMAIQPGSSGSPVVNFWGNVVGVIFAGDRSMWGIFVSHDDLETFLSQY